MFLDYSINHFSAEKNVWHRNITESISTTIELCQNIDQLSQHKTQQRRVVITHSRDDLCYPNKIEMSCVNIGEMRSGWSLSLRMCCVLQEVDAYTKLQPGVGSIPLGCATGHHIVELQPRHRG